MKKMLMGGVAVLLGACTATQVSSGLADGQLACAVSGSVVALQALTPAGTVSPILAKGASSTAVQTACALVSGIAVSPPAAGVAGSVTVKLPASLTIPVGA